MSEHLLPREAYDNYPPVRWGRMALVAGFFFGVTMWLVFSAAGIYGVGHFRIVGSRWSPLIGIAVISGIASVAFGIIWALYMRRLVRKLMNRIYERDPKLAPAPDDDEEFTHRVPAGYHPTTRMNVGGSLYIGWSGITFVPHKRNLPANRKRIDFVPAKAIDLSLVPHEVNPVSRFLNEQLPPLLEVSTGSMTGRFSVPRPEQVIGMIEAILRQQPTAHCDGD